MRRTFVLLPLAAAGLSLALGASAEPPLHKAPAPATKAEKAPPKTPKTTKHRKGRKAEEPKEAHPTLAIAVRRADYDVVEGSLGQSMPGAVCPPEMANVDDRFCIDRWEGSLVEMLSDGREVPWPAFDAPDDSRQMRAVSVSGVYPQGYISGAQAARACAASGKRLCAPVEWRTACMGPERTKYGYGSSLATGRCNDSGYSPMLRLYPQVAQSWRLVGMTEMNDPRLNQLDGTLSPTGSHDGCTNDYGVFDMVGNLHEWTNDPNGTFQGGYYLDTHKNGDGCTYRTVAHEFTYHDYSTGFRCCASPVAP
ncbi:MAG TPA: SUMF1/EgtB/PvdO family nonheme iron enzyme [Polyangiaceae bacterium]